MNKKRIVDIICFLFILLFVYTGVSKFLDFEYFQLTIEQTALLKPYAGFIHWAVPILEILIAVLLAIGRLRLFGLYASFVLMLLFTGYVGAILQFSKQLPCSCGGIVQEMNWQQHLIFNTCFALMAILAVRLEKTKQRNLEATPKAYFT